MGERARKLCEEAKGSAKATKSPGGAAPAGTPMETSGRDPPGSHKVEETTALAGGEAEAAETNHWLSDLIVEPEGRQDAVAGRAAQGETVATPTEVGGASEEKTAPEQVTPDSCCS